MIVNHDRDFLLEMFQHSLFPLLNGSVDWSEDCQKEEQLGQEYISIDEPLHFVLILLDKILLFKALGIWRFEDLNTLK